MTGNFACCMRRIGGAAFAIQQLQLGHAQQVALIVDLLDRTLPDDVIVHARHGKDAVHGTNTELTADLRQRVRLVPTTSVIVRSGLLRCPVTMLLLTRRPRPGRGNRCMRL
jgi:hypothetical protein